jgi:hypothetical protein
MLDLHDCELRGISVKKSPEGPRSCTLHIASEADEIYIVLSGVKFLLCDNFRVGNIIFELSEVSGITDLEARKLIGLPLAGDITPQQVQSIQSIKDAMSSGLLRFVQLHSSYGAEVCVLCEALTVTDS